MSSTQYPPVDDGDKHPPENIHEGDQDSRDDLESGEPDVANIERIYR